MLRCLPFVLLALSACGSPPAEEPKPPSGPPTAVGDPPPPPSRPGEEVSPAPAPAEPDPPEPAATGDAPDEFAPLLEAHNRHRARHCAPPLAWSPEIAGVASRWAEALRERGCPLEHNRNRYGENLAAGSSGALGPKRVADLWYGEVEVYDFERPGFSFEAGHFTQLVWASTREIGCATASCRGIELWVCNYAPAGNIHGEFERNVLPSSCER